MIVTMVLSTFWQGAIVVLVTLLALRCVPVENAKTRYVVWFAALVAVVAVPVLTNTIHLQLWHAATHRNTANPTFLLAAVGPYAGDVLRWLAWPVTAGDILTRAFLVVWCAGTLFGFARLGVSWFRIAAIRRSALEIARVDGVPVLTSSDIAIPIATGITHPAIVLPESLIETLDPAARTCTIEHELAHVRRGDVASNALAQIVRALFFWNPWVHVAGHGLAIEREAACDDWAIRRLGEARDYALCLATLARTFANVHAPLVTPSAAGSRHSLIIRIERLLTMRQRVDSQLNYIAIGGIVVLFAAITVLLQSLLPAPAHADALAGGLPSTSVATTCAQPNAEPKALDPAPPDLPKAQWPSRKVTAIVAVTVTQNGKASAARVYGSSGDAQVDRAVLTAAEKSTYSPKRVDCAPVQSTYLFRADFGP